jgi:hypothetical protein
MLRLRQRDFLPDSAEILVETAARRKNVMSQTRTTALTKVTVLEAVHRVGAVAEVLRREDELDDLTSSGNARAVEPFFAEDFVLSSPANRFMNRGEMLAAIGRTSTPTAFHYTSYERTFEAACVREDLVVLMGSEVTVSEGGRPEFDGKPISRRFTDVWRKEGGAWRKLARQSTITGVART